MSSSTDEAAARTYLDLQWHSGLALTWGVKSSFGNYVAGLDDGEICGDRDSSGRFAFNASRRMRRGRWTHYEFCGTACFSGHGGFLALTIRDPRIESTGERWRLTIAGPADAGGRVCFANLTETVLSDDAATRTWGAVPLLTTDGALLFEGNYEVGEPLDPIHVSRRAADVDPGSITLAVRHHDVGGTRAGN